MEITEIVLLAAGGIIFILSFLIPDKKGEVSEQSKALMKSEIADMVSNEMESIKGQVDDAVEEAVTYAMEKTERSLERLSNEKIMAVSEYSDTVLSEIHKNHEEAMFLYDMLNSKHSNLKETVSTVDRTVKEVEERVNGLIAMASVPAVPTVVTGAESQPVAAPRVAARPVPVPSASMPEMPQPPAQSALARLAAAQARGAQPLTVVQASSVPMASMSVPSTSQTSIAPTAVPAAPVSQTAQPAVTDGRVSFLQEKAAEGRNNNERILELYNQGKSKVAIAKELGLGVGEVKLVIDLFRNQ